MTSPADPRIPGAPSRPAAADDASTASPASGHPATAWPGPLVDALRADPRVIGAADVSAGGGCRGGGCAAVSGSAQTGAAALLVVTTWDGRDAVVADLARLGALALGAPPLVEATEGGRWTGLAADGRRIEVDAVRIGDLRPSAQGERAKVVLDSKALVDQWVRWSAGRNRSAEDDASDAAHAEARQLLRIDEVLRALEALGPSAVRLGHRARPDPIRPQLAGSLRRERERLACASPAGAAIAARIDAALRTCPQQGIGLRIVPGSEPPGDALEDFLRVADGEGFLGDRVLLAEAVKRLHDLSGQTPVFDEGFVLPTFDAVEARWRFGEATGGCSTPLVPGIVVGIGVTPADHLEFWSAPCVREPGCTVACVADTGTRVVRERTAGREAFFSALLGEVEHAWDELAEFLRTARRAGRTPAGDPDAAWRPLHLPASFRSAALRVADRGPGLTWLQAALALARAGHAEDPLVARKLGLAAGRMLRMTPPGADPGCDGA